MGDDGFYKRAPDYFELVKRERLGLWNVAFVNNLVAIRGDVIDSGLVNNCSVCLLLFTTDFVS